MLYVKNGPKGTLVVVEEMHTEHLRRAINLIKTGAHRYYSWSDYQKLSALSSVLIDKLTADNAKLRQLNKGLTAQLRSEFVDRPTVKTTKEDMEHLRTLALQLIRNEGSVAADQLRLVAKAKGFRFTGALLSNVFKDRRFIQIGYRRSFDKSARRRHIGIWGKTPAAA